MQADVGPVRSTWRRVLRDAMHARLIARHYADAILPVGELRAALRGMQRYVADRRRYVALPGAGTLTRYDDNPQLRDWLETTPFDPHYTYQDGWAARLIHADAPEEHVDVGSRITFVVGLTPFTRVVFIDLRPLPVAMPNFDPRPGSVLELPFADQSVDSISCLHVAEHIGLGRYGDPLDPLGTRKAAAELARVVAPGGSLYFSLPVGRPRTNFNAHRVHDPVEVVDMFDGLRLADFAAVLDDGSFDDGVAPADLRGAAWSCGLYRFTR